MRVVEYDADAPDGARLAERPKPSLGRGCGRGEVLVRVMAAGVNPVDAKYIMGDKLPESWMEWSSRRVNGIVPGFDLSGTVVDAPEGSPFPVGSEVFGLSADPLKVARQAFQGSFAEYVVSPVNQLCLKPKGLSHHDAAALPLGMTTVLQAFEQHSLRPGQRLLVIGAAGGVGHLAVQAASRMGVTVVAVSSARRAAFVKTLGASRVLIYNEGDVLEAITAEARANGAFDMVLDTVHSVAEVDRDIEYETVLREREGVIKLPSERGVDPHNYVVLGGSPGQWLTAGVKRICGCNRFPSGFEVFWINMPKAQPALEKTRELCDAGLRAHLAEVHEFSEEAVRTCFRDMRSRRVAGKLVLRMVTEVVV